MDESIRQYQNGELGWNVLTERLERTHQHAQEVADYLIGNKEMVKDEKLAVYSLKRIVKLDSSLAQ